MSGSSGNLHLTLGDKLVKAIIIGALLIYSNIELFTHIVNAGHVNESNIILIQFISYSRDKLRCTNRKPSQFMYPCYSCPL